MVPRRDREGFLAGRRFEFAVERAVFLTVLHRLMVSGSDRACEHWRDDYRVDGIDDLDLHHLYRAMSWLGEQLPRERAGRHARSSRAASRISSRSGLFASRHDLFSELSVVFMDTTTLYFEGRGGDTLGERGHFQGLPAAPQSDGGRHHHRSERPAGMLGDVAGRHHRCHHAASR